MTRVAVYRLYDADGTLLYVGASQNPATRPGRHRRRFAFDKSATKVTWYADRTEAEAAEAAAIAAEHPLRNVEGQGRSYRPWPGSAESRASSAERKALAKQEQLRATAERESHWRMRNAELARLRQEGLDHREIARRFGVTRQRVSQILTRQQQFDK